MIIYLAKLMEGELLPYVAQAEIDSNLLESNAVIENPIQLNGNIFISKAFVSVELKFNFKVTFDCDRCLAPVKMQLSAKVSEQIEKADIKKGKLGEFVDITDSLNEAVLLAIPTKVLCKADCKGLCINCGASLNKEKCNCIKANTEDELNNAFCVLKNINLQAGGATNGSTKKKNIEG